MAGNVLLLTASRTGGVPSRAFTSSPSSPKTLSLLGTSLGLDGLLKRFVTIENLSLTGGYMVLFPGDIGESSSDSKPSETRLAVSPSTAVILQLAFASVRRDSPLFGETFSSTEDMRDSEKKLPVDIEGAIDKDERTLALTELRFSVSSIIIRNFGVSS